MKYIFLLLARAMVALSCARNPTSPPAVDPHSAPQMSAARSDVTDEGPYRLWGEWTFYINENHDGVDVVPKRDLHFHLNALRFLEDYCKDCVTIQSIRKRGDGTIDLTVRITHPFSGFPQFTGFDVKGIMMFNGSYEYPIAGDADDFPRIPVEGPFFRASWKEVGDPEVLNPDGYTFRWNPEWDSGSSQPIFNYWQGKYATGIPTAHINAFLNYYSHEERHMFAHDRSVSGTYHIWLPPGPVVAGYAVEACWEPPTVVPVTDPLTDFPITANQPEPYLFENIANEGEPVTECEDCCRGFVPEDCYRFRFRYKEWVNHRYGTHWLYRPAPVFGGNGAPSWFWIPCPEHEGWFTGNGIGTCPYGNGIHRFFTFIERYDESPPHEGDKAWTFVDIVTDDPDLE